MLSSQPYGVTAQHDRYTAHSEIVVNSGDWRSGLAKYPLLCTMFSTASNQLSICAFKLQNWSREEDLQLKPFSRVSLI